MKRLLDDIAQNGERRTEPLPPRSTDITPEMSREIQEIVQVNEQGSPGNRFLKHTRAAVSNDAQAIDHRRFALVRAYTRRLVFHYVFVPQGQCFLCRATALPVLTAKRPTSTVRRT